MPQQNHPIRLLIVVTASIFFVEFGIMSFLHVFSVSSEEFVNLIDATTLVIIIYPILYYFAFKPLFEANDELTKKTQEVEKSRKIAFDIAAKLNNEEEKLTEEKIKAENLANDLKKFKLALDNASDQIIITDVEGTVIYANAAVEKITGYKPEEVIGKKSGVLWKSPMPREYYQNLWHTIKEQKKTFIGEIQNKRKNGELYTARINISPVLDNNRNVIFFVGIERDVTKEREIDKAKDEFISLASHQMRTPLTAIKWYAEMILGGDAGKLNKKQDSYFKEIYAAGLRMNDTIKSFLQILRLETGKMANNPVPIDLKEIVTSIVQELKSEIEKKQLQVVEQYEDPLPFPEVDAELIHVILKNLVSNAVKYAFEKKEVKISLHNVTKGSVVDKKMITQDSVMVSVYAVDFGISATEREKIFTKFFRTENARKSDPNGNGLGLYMTKKMVDIIGGSIWFDSEEGKGTTFFVRLPIEQKRLVY